MTTAEVREEALGHGEAADQLKAPSGLKFGLLANFVGTGWSAVMQLICVPLYIRFMGIESYGLIGFYVMLQAMLQVLDLGLSPTINREMARYSVQPEKMEEARNLVRTLEAGYWMVGVAIGLAIIGGSGWLSLHWIHANGLSRQKVVQALMLMGLLSVFQWPVSFYQGGLMGLHRQVLFNTIRVMVVTLNSVGAVLALWLISPTITVLLAWQAGVSMVQAVVLRAALGKTLGSRPDNGKIDLRLLGNIWRFAAGMSGITAIGLILTQIDKVFVSKLLPLRSFGYYSLAWTVANGLLLVAAAVYAVIFPRMAAQVAAGDEKGIRHSYHAGTQLTAVLVLPFAAVLCFFSRDVLQLWTRNPETATYAAPILALLVVGSALNGLLYLPFALQLAFGWTKLNLVAGVVSVVVVVPLIVPLTREFGPMGAAAVWAGLNILNMLITVPIMHRRVLRAETWKYFCDFGLPLVSAFGVAALGRLVFVTSISAVRNLAAISSVWALAALLGVLTSSDLRSWSLAQLGQLRMQNARRSGSLT